MCGPPLIIDCFVPGDPAEPGENGYLPPVVWQRADSGQESLLADLLGGKAIATQPGRNPSTRRFSSRPFPASPTLKASTSINVAKLGAEAFVRYCRRWAENPSRERGEIKIGDIRTAENLSYRNMFLSGDGASLGGALKNNTPAEEVVETRDHAEQEGCP